MMRIRCSFTLDPDVHDHHFYAVESLRVWLRQEKKRGASKEALLQRSNAFHRDVYLSGLYLHKLQPELPEQIANILLSEQVSSSAFLSRLTQSGIGEQPELVMLGSDGFDTGVLDELSEIKLQLQLLVENIQPAHDVQTQLAGIEQNQQQLKTYLEEVSAAQRERLQAEHNAVDQASELASSELVPPEIALVEHQSASLLADNEHRQQITAQLVAIEQGQQQLMQQLNAIRKQLSQTSGQAPVAGNAAANSVDAAKKLVTQLERASRIKAKGLW